MTYFIKQDWALTPIRHVWACIYLSGMLMHVLPLSIFKHVFSRASLNMYFLKHGKTCNLSNMFQHILHCVLWHVQALPFRSCMLVHVFHFSCMFKHIFFRACVNMYLPWECLGMDHSRKCLDTYFPQACLGMYIYSGMYPPLSLLKHVPTQSIFKHVIFSGMFWQVFSLIYFSCTLLKACVSMYPLRASLGMYPILENVYANTSFFSSMFGHKPILVHV